jgi:hypothetical protein
MANTTNTSSTAATTTAAHEPKYRSNNSKRVAETIGGGLRGEGAGSHLSSCAEEDEITVRKKQFTEKIFLLWMAQVKEDVLSRQG